MSARRSSTLVIAIIFLLVSCVSHGMRPQKTAKAAPKQVTEDHQLFHGPLVVTAPAP